MSVYDLIGDRIMGTVAVAAGLADYSFDVGVPAGFSSMGVRLGNGSRPMYMAINGNAAGGGAPAPGSVYEFGAGALTTGSPDVLARTDIFKSSNADGKVNWTSAHQPILIFSFAPADVVNSLLQGHFWTARPAWFRRGPWFGQGTGVTDRKMYWYTGTADVLLFSFNETTGALTLPSGNYVDLTSNQTVAGDKTFSGFVSFTRATAPQLNVVSTDAGAGGGPGLDLYRQSPSPADFDAGPYLNFVMRTSTVPNDEVVAQIIGYMTTRGAGSENGGLDIYTLVNGVGAQLIGWRDGMIVGAAVTGGYKGANALNVAGGIFDNGVRVPAEMSAAHYEERTAAATAGGTFTSGSWQKRVLTNEVADPAALGSLTTGVVTLAAGTYLALFWGVAAYVDKHQARLRNTSDSVTAGIGCSAHAVSGGSTFQTMSWGVARFTIASTKTFELQHRCQTTRATDGLGVAAGFDEENVFAGVIFARVAY